jgi:hypothetical protein
VQGLDRGCSTLQPLHHRTLAVGTGWDFIISIMCADVAVYECGSEAKAQGWPQTGKDAAGKTEGCGCCCVAFRRFGLGVL